ncbi:MAG: DNA-binding response regulator [Ferruginibacter sp.]|nr:DNA-binding response regulator [Ferruginibacter sp.]
MEKILLVDDHSIIRSGLKMLLSSDLGHYQFEEAANGEMAMEQINSEELALIVLDINIPGTDTFALVEETIRLKPNSRILIFSMNSENIYAKRFLKMGVKGYVRKDEPAEEIKNAVFTVLNGKRYISKTLGENLAREMFEKNSDNPFDKLSPKQFEIVRFLVMGKTISDICSCMNLHSSTVSTQKNRIFEKLNVANLVDLYALAKMHLNASTAA